MINCDKDKILNPKTNRCVLKTGVIGKKILSSQPQRVTRKSKRTTRKSRKISRKSSGSSISNGPCKIKCNKLQICNPKTKRCVLKTGEVGKKLLSSKSKSSSSSTKNSDLCKTKKCDLLKICNPKTGLCVKKSGNIGKNLIKSKKTIPKKKLFYAQDKVMVGKKIGIVQSRNSHVDGKITYDIKFDSKIVEYIPASKVSSINNYT